MRQRRRPFGEIGQEACGDDSFRVVALERHFRVGVIPVDAERIHAETFSQANTAQENLKGTSKAVSQEVGDVFNAIYDEIIGVCKIASAYYRFEPLKKEQFTFNKVLANLGGAKKAAKTEPATAVQ